MKKCTYCGRENDDEVMNCRECGTEFLRPTSADVHNQRSKAISLGWLRFVGYAVLVLLLLPIAFPKIVKSRITRIKHSCFENLCALQSAKQTYVREHHLKPDDWINLTKVPLPFRLERMPTCPMGGRYEMVIRASNWPACSEPLHDFSHLTNYLLEQGLYQKYLGKPDVK